ncbi:MAG: hypothetical protein IPL78_36400 [Chloroflexi bacterium]|nr:hypothetical protein [Chloroflexota bacterium]
MDDDFEFRCGAARHDNAAAAKRPPTSSKQFVNEQALKMYWLKDQTGNKVKLDRRQTLFVATTALADFTRKIVLLPPHLPQLRRPPGRTER